MTQIQFASTFKWCGLQSVLKVLSMAGGTKTYTVSTERTFKYCVDNIWTDTYDCDEREEIDVYAHLLPAVKGMMNGYRGYESQGFFQSCFYSIILRKEDLGSVAEAEKYVLDKDNYIDVLMHRVFPMPWCPAPTPTESALMAMESSPTKESLAAVYVSTIKDYISLLDDGEKTRLCRNLRVDYESGQKPKLSKSSSNSSKTVQKSKNSKPRKPSAKFTKSTKSKKSNKISKPLKT